MTDLKLYCRSERELQSLVLTVRITLTDFGMKFGIEKHKILFIRRGKMINIDGTKMLDGKRMKQVEEGWQKYLDAIQNWSHEKEVKEGLKSEDFLIETMRKSSMERVEASAEIFPRMTVISPSFLAWRFCGKA